VLRPRGDVRFRIVADEGVVIRQQAAEVLVVNEVGARILQLLDGKRSLAQVRACLAAEFAAEPAELERDVAAYVDALIAAGVVEEVTP
jgi:hypothetical protein